jgi:hypothetical protein
MIEGESVLAPGRELKLRAAVQRGVACGRREASAAKTTKWATGPSKAKRLETAVAKRVCNSKEYLYILI